MTEREQQILKIVYDILHSGFSIDTESDQDYVCEVIKEKVESLID